MKIQITPVAKPRMTRSDKWQQRDCVIRYREYADHLRAAYRGHELPERLEVRFVLPMPKSWHDRKRRDCEGKPHQSKPDIDNLLKGVMDVLSEDGDQHIYQVSAVKIWGVSGSIDISEIT